MDIEQFLTEFSQYLQTGPGTDLLTIFFTVLVTCFFISLFMYEVIKGFCYVLSEVCERVTDSIFKHTKLYKEKHAKALATYSICEDTVHQLWAEDAIDHGQYMVFLNSLEEHRDRHTRG